MLSHKNFLKTFLKFPAKFNDFFLRYGPKTSFRATFGPKLGTRHFLSKIMVRHFKSIPKSEKSNGRKYENYCYRQTDTQDIGTQDPGQVQKDVQGDLLSGQICHTNEILFNFTHTGVWGKIKFGWYLPSSKIRGRGQRTPGDH